MKARDKVKAFLIVGLVSSILGLALLYIFVELLGLNKNVANLAQLLVILQVNFILNMKYTWKESPTTLRDFFRKWVSFHLVHSVSSLSNVAAFAVLIVWLPYAISYGITLGLVAILNYLGMDKFVFKGES